MSKWISTKDRLPEIGQRALTSGYMYDDPTRGRWQDVGSFTTEGWFYDEDYDHYPPTHWMPLPEDPSEDV